MIRVVTDSTSDLPRDAAEQLGIQIVPLRVLFGDQTFLDGVEITADAFFTRLRTSTVLPTTSQPSPADFQRVFEEIVRAGDEIVCLTISSLLSGTYASATAAQAAMPDAPITVIDSQTTSMAMGMVAEEAARLALNGANREQIATRIRQLLPLTRVYFAVDTLEYLHRGGRIGGAQAFLGTLLNVKPLLTLANGRVEALERVRTKRKALDRMVEVAAQHTQETGHPYRVVVIHAQAADEAAYVAQLVTGKINCAHLRQTQVGPVIGVHVGPGVVGIALMPVLPG